MQDNTYVNALGREPIKICKYMRWPDGPLFAVSHGQVDCWATTGASGNHAQVRDLRRELLSIWASIG